jgi:hypothetical protein
MSFEKYEPDFYPYSPGINYRAGSNPVIRKMPHTGKYHTILLSSAVIPGLIRLEHGIISVN